MAQWVDMKAEKSRTERMSVRDNLYLRLIRDYWFVGSQPESQKT